MLDIPTEIGKMRDMKIKVIVHKAEEGGFWAEVPALPGCVSQGENREALEANLKEAIEGFLAVGSELPGNDPNAEILELAI
jgi:predicted RNase H-like HicB family nuclease